MTIATTLLFLEAIPSFLFWWREGVVAMAITREATITLTFFWERKGGGHDYIPSSSLGSSALLPLLGKGERWWSIPSPNRSRPTSPSSSGRGRDGGPDHIPSSSLGSSVLLPLLGKGKGWWSKHQPNRPRPTSTSSSGRGRDGGIWKWVDGVMAIFSLSFLF